MALTSAFNENQANTALASLNKNYSNLIGDIKNKTQSFVNTIGTQWASPIAVKFFTGSDGFDQALKSFITSVTDTYEQVNKSVNSAVSRKASENGSTHKNVQFNRQNFSVNYASIRSEIGGTTGVDRANAEATAKTLNNIKTTAATYLNGVRQGLARSGIMDATAQANLNTSISEIQKSINTGIENIINSTISSIQETVKQNGDTDGQIANAFLVK